MRAAARQRAEPPLEALPRLFSDTRQPRRRLFFALMEIDNEVFGGDCLESEPWIVNRRRMRANRQYEDDKQDPCEEAR